MRDEMVVLVCGGRDFGDRALVYATLDGIDAMTPITRIVHGGARGADALARDWAHVRQVDVRCYPANWDLHGRAAGIIRNGVMLLKEKPSLVVAFPGARGTEDMVRRAERAGVKVIRTQAKAT